MFPPQPFLAIKMMCTHRGTNPFLKTRLMSAVVVVFHLVIAINTLLLSTWTVGYVQFSRVKKIRTFQVAIVPTVSVRQIAGCLPWIRTICDPVPCQSMSLVRLLGYA